MRKLFLLVFGVALVLSSASCSNSNPSAPTSICTVGCDVGSTPVVSITTVDTNFMPNNVIPDTGITISVNLNLRT